MKTTVDIADPLLSAAKELARERGMSFKQVLEAALRDLLTQQHAPSPPFRLRDASVDGEGLRPDLVDGDWEGIRSLIYEDRGVDRS
ncbi:MAG: DUF2191 domain-containing protein [Acidobacteriota bacterium]